LNILALNIKEQEEYSQKVDTKKKELREEITAKLKKMEVSFDVIQNAVISIYDEQLRNINKRQSTLHTNLIQMKEVEIDAVKKNRKTRRKQENLTNVGGGLMVIILLKHKLMDIPKFRNV